MNSRKIPLGKPFIKKDIVLKEIEKVLDRRWISGGPAIQEFEQACKEYNNDTENEYVAVSNATVGLELCLEYIIERTKYFRGNKDEVIVPSWSWVASAFSIKRKGLKPVWVDVNEYGVPEPEHVNRLINDKTRAIMLVHQMGIPCDMDKFREISLYRGIPIIEDCACAFGSEYNEKKIGTGPNLKVFSFQARKCLTTGEGGMIVVPSLEKAEWFRSMRAFGTNVSPLERDKANHLLKEQFDKIGTNYKLSDVQAAMGLAHLQYFDEEIELRDNAAFLYNCLIDGMEYDGYGVKRPFKHLPPYCTRYNWQNYHVLLDEKHNRDNVVDLMRKRGIGCKWDIQAIHLEPAINEGKVILPITEKFHNHGLWLPFYAEITQQEQCDVIDTLKEILGNE